MTTALPKIYLASKSPRRHEILHGLHVPFEYIESSYDEKISDVEDLVPEEKSAKLASLKAMYASQALETGLVIGADTIVVDGSEILGKPKDRADAKRMLKELSGKKHRVISGIALVDVEKKKIFSHSEITYVYFKALTDKDIETYLDTKEPYDKAGAYGIQGVGACFISHLSGSFSAVMGLPVFETVALLRQFWKE